MNADDYLDGVDTTVPTKAALLVAEDWELRNFGKPPSERVSMSEGGVFYRETCGHLKCAGEDHCLRTAHEDADLDILIESATEPVRKAPVVSAGGPSTLAQLVKQGMAAGLIQPTQSYF